MWGLGFRVMHKSLHCPQVAVFSIISAVSSTVAIMEEFVFFHVGWGVPPSRKRCFAYFVANTSAAC